MPAPTPPYAYHVNFDQVVSESYLIFKRERKEKEAMSTLRDENGSLLPPNFVEQFRGLQSNVEYTKEAIDEITLDIKAIKATIDLYQKTNVSRFDSIEEKLNMILSKF